MALQTPSPSGGVDRLSPQETAELAEILKRLEQQGVSIEDVEAYGSVGGPKTDDELWDAIYALTNYKIPRVAVCLEHNHVAPFTIFADVYFCRRLDVCMIGNRGGGKTTISGFLHGAKCRWNPGYKSAMVGATDKQAGRGYAEFKRFIRTLGAEVVASLMSKTSFLNWAVVEVLIGTLKQMNGPHPHLAQFDELELSTKQIFEEFQNMAQGDDLYPSQNLLSSTRKFVFGLIQQIVKQADEDVREGIKPEWDVLIFCVFETMREVPNCQNVPAKERKKRIKQYNKEEGTDIDPCSSCDCHAVTKGRWEDGPLKGQRRTFADVCEGKAARSRGFVRLDDVHRRFKRLSQEVWEAQQQCLKPDPAGLVHKWLGERHLLPTWYPKPEYGAVYASIDWGGANAHSVHLQQVLDVPVEIEVDLGQLMHGEPNGIVFKKRLREGDIVTFDEIYYEGGSYRELARRIFARIKQWHDHGFAFPIRAWIADPASKTAKEDVREYAHDQGITPPEFVGRSPDRVESVKKHKEWGADDRLHVVDRMCPWLVEEYNFYHYPPEPDGKNRAEDPVKDFDHAMDDQRLFIWWLYKGGYSDLGAGEKPSSRPRPSERGPVEKQSGMREALGHPGRDDGLSPVASTGRYMAQSPSRANVRRVPGPQRPGR